MGARRSSRWPKVRAEHLKKHPTCAVCNGTKSLEVHHIIPFYIRPDLELDPGNLITLCESGRYGLNCHLFVGHLGNYSGHNPSLPQMAKDLNDRIVEARSLIAARKD